MGEVEIPLSIIIMEITFYILGVGGTGGNFAKELSRMLTTMKENEIKTRVVLIDGDYVEKKNLARQPFYEDFINCNKAESLSNLINDSFNTSTTAVGRFISTPEEMMEIIEMTKSIGKDRLVILVGCIDNHQCRRTLETVFNSLEDCLYWDSANEFSDGEVVFAAKVGGKVYSPCRSSYYPNILTDESISRAEESCEALNNVAPQHIVTNLMAGNILLSATASLFQGELPKGIVYFDAFKPFMKHKQYEEVISNDEG